MSEWISVEERLPEENEQVLMCAINFVGEAYINYDEKWMRFGFEIEDFLQATVTHWMPMPEPPEV